MQRKISLTRGVATGGPRGAMAPYFNFRTKQGPNISVSNIRDIVFRNIQKLYGTEISQFLPCMLQILDNLWRFFTFFNNRVNKSFYVEPSEKVRYLTLGVLKSFFLWTIRKKTTMNESLKLRLWGK